MGFIRNLSCDTFSARGENKEFLRVCLGAFIGDRESCKPLSAEGFLCIVALETRTPVEAPLVRDSKMDAVEDLVDGVDGGNGVANGVTNGVKETAFDDTHFTRYPTERSRVQEVRIIVNTARWFPTYILRL
jgi:hypothetical protein